MECTIKISRAVQLPLIQVVLFLVDFCICIFFFFLIEMKYFLGKVVRTSQLYQPWKYVCTYRPESRESKFLKDGDDKCFLSKMPTVVQSTLDRIWSINSLTHNYLKQTKSNKYVCSTYDIRDIRSARCFNDERVNKSNVHLEYFVYIIAQIHCFQSVNSCVYPQ